MATAQEQATRAIAAFMRTNPSDKPEELEKACERLIDAMRLATPRKKLCDYSFDEMCVEMAKLLSEPKPVHQHQTDNIPLFLSLTDDRASFRSLIRRPNIRVTSPTNVNVVECRQRITCKVDRGSSVVVPLISDARWFTELCFGIHSVRLAKIERKATSVQTDNNPMSGIHAATISYGRTSSSGHIIEHGAIDELVRKMGQLFAGQDSGADRSYTMLPFASSFDPDRYWLPVPKGDPGCYHLEVSLNGSQFESFEVEFTCMLFRGEARPTLGPRLVLPRVNSQFMLGQTASCCDGFFEVRMPVDEAAGCVGMALAGAYDLRPGQLLDEAVLFHGEESIIAWSAASLREGFARKMGPAVGHFTDGIHLLEFGPHMSDPQRAMSITSTDEPLTLRLRFAKGDVDTNMALVRTLLLQIRRIHMRG
ncbi:uncharacterized protein ACA1_057030 [Acanthamoeba castellanii str. Neff]|uniref:Uncharacterized protein n=1 Tax=Acanthamoeba castellanii (strain ATCC 30010 / Neff) TaxID=1257118 RepID=L8GYB5_ACACF|nr:uncharacterized protein ACA1_057030 [Acanthamoeba castellanii str. Neff]ELR17071.1 hypothetical protein ACA1_057030 [Acanthamoeba castellanii str. Neff]